MIGGRVKNLLLFVGALALVIVLPRRRKPGYPKKILIIQMAKLGDMVCTTPMFRAVKAAYPSSELCVIGDAINKEILAGNQDVDRYVVFKKGIERELRKESFDYCAIPNPDFRSLVAAVYGGVRSICVPEVTGGSVNQTRTFILLSRFVLRVPFRMGAYAPRERLRLLEPLGIVADDTRKWLSFTDEAKRKIEALLSSHGIRKEDLLVGISPAAGHRTKQWPAKRFAAVADYLHRNQGAKIIMIGGPADMKEADAMRRALRHEGALDTTGRLSIEELKAAVSQLNLFISVDTGPVYVAEAFGVPTIDITGPIDEREQPPIGKLHKVIVPPVREKPELFVMNARGYDYKEARRQVESITPEMVFQAIDELYPLIGKERPL